MELHIRNQSIFDVEEADTLALPVDGSGPGLEGNIARQFMKRVGVEQMHELYAPPPYYPFNGDTYWSSSVPPGKTHFRHICCLGVLSHASGANHEGHVASAFGKMIRDAPWGPDHGEAIAWPVLTAGHRLSYVDSIYLMLKVFHAVNAGPYWGTTLYVTESNPEKFAILKSIVEP